MLNETINTDEATNLWFKHITRCLPLDDLDWLRKQNKKHRKESGICKDIKNKSNYRAMKWYYEAQILLLGVDFYEELYAALKDIEQQVYAKIETSTYEKKTLQSGWLDYEKHKRIEALTKELENLQTELTILTIHTDILSSI